MCQLADRKSRRNNIRKMAGVLPPLHVIRIQCAAEERIHERGIGSIGLKSGIHHRGMRSTAQFLEIAMRCRHVLILQACHGAADTVQKKSARLL